ncbi:hypothetical protein ABEG18_08120 [Alsobacter sp. KACC 23698]|uniref:Uncharacterized protein n=1 Tax=Alsobacter sp. KACC 23698 TaxID=3149229 RepID=A0AAU7JK82_9HYPH
MTGPDRPPIVTIVTDVTGGSATGSITTDHPNAELTVALRDLERVGRAAPPAKRVEPPAPHRTTRAERRAMRKARPKKTQVQIPEVRLGETATGRPIIRPIHDDVEGWFNVARRTFGTVSDSFARTQIRFLLRGLRTAMFGESTDAVEMNAALAQIAGIEPKNELEAALATQMAVTHVVAMRLLGRAGTTDPTLPHFAATGLVTAKFLRAFAGQAEVLAKLRRPAVQTVRVERVEVQAGGQAVVGLVNNNKLPRRRGAKQLARRAHGTQDE